MKEHYFKIYFQLKVKERIMKTKVKWGILSTAKIGTEKVIPAMRLGEYCDMVAISSRNIEKAKAAAETKYSQSLRFL